MTKTRIALVALGLLSGVGCGGSGAAPTPDSGPLPMDQCINSGDLAIARSLFAMTDAGSLDAGSGDGGGIPTGYGGVIGDQVQYCAVGPCLSNILQESGVESCMADCLASGPAAGLSIGCTACFLEVLNCARDYCLNDCLGTNQQLCNDCTATYCVPRLVDCSGLPAAP